MTFYLGFNDYKIGPPPNWRNFLKKNGKLKRKKYIAAVEDYMVAAHKRHVETIHALDDERARTGALVSDIDDSLRPLMDRISMRAAEWRGPYSEDDE